MMHTGDKKCHLYLNMNQRSEWITLKEKPRSGVQPDLHPKRAYELKQLTGMFIGPVASSQGKDPTNVVKYLAP